MTTADRKISKLALLAVTLALVLFLAGLSSASAEDIRIDVDRTCSPEEFRPNEWVVFECVSHLTNLGSTPITDIRAGVVSAEGVIPDHFRILYTVDGQAMPQNPTDIGVGGQGVLQPHETVEARHITLLWMDSEGTYEGDWQVSAGEQVVKKLPLRHEARADAAQPAKDLLVSRKLLAGGPGQKAVYETTVANRGTRAVTGLTLTERYNPEASLLETDPPATSEQADVQIARWTLDSFGKESLAPGESLTLTTVYATSPNGCDYIQTGAMVEATVGGKAQRYGARTEDVQGGRCAGEAVGDRIVENPPIAAPPGPILMPAAGEGLGEATFDVVWPVAFLAAAGAGLIATALVVRRRARR